MQVDSSWPKKLPDDKAIASFDKRATDIAKLITKRTREPSQKDSFPTRHLPELAIKLDSSPDDWIAEITDFYGRTKGRYYLHEGYEFAFVDDAYRKLNSLSADIASKAPFNDGFSVSFIEEAVFRWIKCSQTKEKFGQFSTYLLNECSRKYTSHRILVPLEYIEIEQDFMLGDTLVRTIPASLFDLTEEYAEKKHGTKNGRRDSYGELRKQLVNRTAVEVTVGGEPKYAQERALEIATEMAGVLRYLSPASVSSVLPSLIQTMGYGHIPSLTTLTIAEDRIQTQSTKFVNFHMARWQLPHDYLANSMDLGLSKLSIFFDGSTLSNYATRFREAFRVYCQALSRFEPQDRIVGVISALECLFVAGSSDPLAHTVSERMAFLIAKEGKERRRVATTYKQAYRLRSRIVHHSAKFKEEEMADALFRDATLAFHRAVEGISYFASHKDFLDAIDDVKFGVTLTGAAARN